MGKRCNVCYGLGYFVVTFLGETIGKTRCFKCLGSGVIVKTLPYCTWKAAGYPMYLEPVEQANG